MSKAAVTKQVENAKQIIAEVKSFSRNAFLAGLGVYGTTPQQRSKSFKEVAKTSSNIFNELVKAGEGLEKKGKQLVEEKLKTVNEQLDSVKSTVTERIEKLKTAANNAKAPAKKAAAKAPVKKVAAKAPAKKVAAKAPVKAAAKPASVEAPVVAAEAAVQA